jgi:RHS repeat-associated protein
MLDDLGLVHMNGRIYDPLLGRFLSADVLVQVPGDLQSYNRYSYVRNNPLSYTDPTGFAESDAKKKQEEEEKRKAAEKAARDAAWKEGGFMGLLGYHTGGAIGTIVSTQASAKADQAQPADTPKAQVQGINNELDDKISLKMPQLRVDDIKVQPRLPGEAKAEKEMEEYLAGDDFVKDLRPMTESEQAAADDSETTIMYIITDGKGGFEPKPGLRFPLHVAGARSETLVRTHEQDHVNRLSGNGRVVDLFRDTPAGVGVAVTGARGKIALEYLGNKAALSAAAGLDQDDYRVRNYVTQAKQENFSYLTNWNALDTK